MPQGLSYNVDIVMCIDCTGSMGGLLDTVKVNALKFYPDLKARCEEKEKEISDLRIRVIGFRDLGYDKDKAITDSGFLSIPEQEDKFKEIVNSFTASGGGPEPESGLEALAMAINSDWTHGGDKRRHVIVVWTDASTHPLGESGKDGKRTTYTHRRLRSAYLSLKRNITWLWTYQDYPNLHIQNTNNAIEGVFTDIKTKLRVHAGITKDRRIALIQEYIARHY